MSDRFDGSPLSRRDFVRLSAATGAALSLPGNATADTDREAFDAEYRYVQNHTPTDHAVPTLVTFTDASGPAAMEAAVSTAVLTTLEPRPAAYAPLTVAQAETVADLPSADRFQFSPGSNPFWRVGYYPLGVFPEAERSVDFVGFEQLKDGLAELEDRHPDRVRVKQMAGDGTSPGHLNNATGRDDPKKMMVAEVTNFDGDVPFEDKEKVFYSCSLHGLERAGAEAGARIIENIARGDQYARGPDESKQSITELLDEAVLVFGFTNPDGWAVRNPQYDSGWQTGGPGASHTRVPAAPLYERGNAEIYDTNRQYPVVGVILPSHYPGDPETVEDNERGRVTEDNVPDALAVVEHFRGYENLNYGADLHGGPVFNEFVLGLVSQDQYNTRELHETYEMCRVIDEVLEEELEVWTTLGDLKLMLLGEQQLDPGLLFGVAPEEAFDYAGIFDTIGYNVSGAMLDWMSHPEEFGGLGMTTLDFEMAFSHMTGGNVYNPELVDMEVRGYRTAIRTIARFAVANSDTPTTEDEFSATTRTRFDDDADPQRVAYVTTGEVGTDADALRRTSADLNFADGGEGDGGGGGGAGTVYDETTVADAVDVDETVAATFAVEEAGLHSLYVHPHAHQAFFDLQLVAPDGSVAADHEAIGDERAGGKCCGHPEFTVSDPDPGEWTLRVTNVGHDARAVRTKFGTLAASSTNPDPVPAVGYDQRDYDVTPFRFFEEYADSIEDDGVLEPVTVAEAADGALEGYDHAVVIHDYGANGGADYVGASEGPVGYRPPSNPTPGFDEPDYVAALDDYVSGGGNLALTDMGLNLLTELDNDVVSGVPDDAVTTAEYILGKVTSKDLDARLMTDVRSIQRQLLKAPPLGYTPGSEGGAVGEFPMRLVDEGSFTAAAGDGEAVVAATTDGGVSVGSITGDGGTGVHVVSSLLPPATQKNLHPFGMVNYAVSFLGYLLLTSALGFQQVRRTADDPEGTTYGAGPPDAGGPGSEPPQLSASGTRSDDGSFFTGGQTNQVDVTVEEVSATATVTDEVPTEWTVLEGGSRRGDSRVVELGAVEPEEAPRTFTYFAEAPEGGSGEYTFGPAVAERGEETADVAGTDTNYVGPSQNQSADGDSGTFDPIGLDLSEL